MHYVQEDRLIKNVFLNVVLLYMNKTFSTMCLKEFLYSAKADFSLIINKRGITMYYPIQIPYILYDEFKAKVRYIEKTVPSLSNFVICFWEMSPKTYDKENIKNIIVADGCIDLIVSFDDKKIGFAGMSHTEFDYTINLPSRFIGARLMPGAFHQLTQLPAKIAMDSFISLDKVDAAFDTDVFFSSPYDEAKEYIVRYFLQWTKGIKPDAFTKLFNDLSGRQPETTAKLYDSLNYSPRQCQRIFEKHFGISPKMVLSILRFQKCLEVLTSNKARPSDVLEVTQYYDQAHFNNDFKQNLGITPLELIKMYVD